MVLLTSLAAATHFTKTQERAANIHGKANCILRVRVDGDQRGLNPHATVDNPPPLPGDISVDNSSSSWTPGPAPQETHPTTGPLDGKTPLPRCYLSATHTPLSLHNITTTRQAAYWSLQNWTPQMRCQTLYSPRQPNTQICLEHREGQKLRWLRASESVLLHLTYYSS